MSTDLLTQFDETFLATYNPAQSQVLDDPCTHDHDLVILMNAITTSCKLITSAVQRAGVAKLYGLAGEVNSSTGDDQKEA